MNIWKGLLFMGGYMSISMAQTEAALDAQTEPATPRAVVEEFLQAVRSAAKIVAHQLNSEAPTDVLRTPEDYARHVAEFKRDYGDFELEVTELIAEGDRVYARWRQIGCHVGAIDGFAPTRRKVVELASAVYRVVDGRIVEYWIQVDRQGTEAQLRSNREVPALAACA